MNKPNRFLWAYNAEQLRCDPVMTRERAAAMLRNWRSRRAEGYTVTVVRADESAALAANIRAANNRPFVW